MNEEDTKYAIGIDLGGTKIDIGVVDEKGRILHQLRLLTEANKGPEDIVDRMIKGIHTLMQQANIPIQGIGIGVAGQIDPKTGEVIFAPNLKWRNIKLREKIENEFHIPVQIINDVRAITFAEWLYGAGQQCDDFICLFIGTGIGSGIVSGGRILTGHTNTFGEVGHMTVDFNGPICSCGNRGCLEAFAGGWGIAARGQEAIQNKENSARSQRLLEMAGHDVNALRANMVIDAYREGDELAREVISNSKNALIAGCVSLINILNPRRIILGGGVIDGLPEWIDEVKQGVQALALKAASHSLEIVKAKLSLAIGVVGSASTIFHETSS